MKRFVVSNARAISLVLLGAFTGVLFLNPVGAHVGNTIDHLWNSPGHIQAKAKQRFYTKDQSDAQFRPQWARIAADGTVVEQTGGIEVSVAQAGVYHVRFPTSQIRRGLSVTPVFDENSSFVSVGLCGLEENFCGGGKQEGPEWVLVFITSSSDTPSNRPFYIVSTP